MNSNDKCVYVNLYKSLFKYFNETGHKNFKTLMDWQIEPHINDNEVGTFFEQINSEIKSNSDSNKAGLETKNEGCFNHLNERIYNLDLPVNDLINLIESNINQNINDIYQVDKPSNNTINKILKKAISNNIDIVNNNDNEILNSLFSDRGICETHTVQEYILIESLIRNNNLISEEIKSLANSNYDMSKIDENIISIIKEIKVKSFEKIQEEKKTINKN